MKIFFYYKVDRGFYESAYAQWQREGGDFEAHLMRAQTSVFSLKAELERQGCEVILDIRSSYLLPPARRYRWPQGLGYFLRAVLWGTAFDPWLLQKDLVRRIRACQPDVVFLPPGSSIWPSTLRTLRAEGFPLAQWCGMPANTMLPRDRAALPYFDLIMQVANLEPGLRAAGAQGQIKYVPLGINTEVYHPVALTAEEQASYQSEVCFIGGLGTQLHSARRRMVEYALAQGVSMKIWGGYREQVAGSPIEAVWQGQVWGQDQVRALCATKIGLNFHVDHHSHELDRGLNLRAFELPACGVFQLLQRVPSVNEFFEEGREIVCFDTPAEMVEQINYYLAHPAEREAIAAAGHRRVLREHTWSQRVAQVVAHLRQLVKA